MKKMRYFAPVFLALLVLVPWLAVGAQGTEASNPPWATVRATANATPGFPFPTNFESDFAIALYDTNGNGVIDSYTGADPNVVFPFSHNLIATRLGQRIGSPFVIGNPSAFGGFCGHLLVYAEQIIGNDTFFMWFAFQDPNRTIPVGCGSWEMDFGAGSYSGSNDVRTAANVHHATFVGGFLTSDGAISGTQHGPAGVRWMTPGTFANPASNIFSWNPTSAPHASWPQALPEFIAFEPGGTPFDSFFISLTNVVIDVPIIHETGWDGISLFQNHHKGFGRTISAVASASGAGVSPPVYPDVSLSTDRLDFHYQRVGAASAPQTVAISNAGQGDLELKQLRISGPDAGNFQIVRDGCSFATLAPGSRCEVDVTFTATATSNSSSPSSMFNHTLRSLLVMPSFRATLDIPSNAPPTALHQVNLYGVHDLRLKEFLQVERAIDQYRIDIDWPKPETESPEKK